MYCVDRNKYTSLLLGCAKLIEPFLFLRPEKMKCQPKLPEIDLIPDFIQRHPKFEYPLESLIKVKASKISRWENETEIMYAHCDYGKPTRSTPCSAHSLKHWINLRNSQPETKFRLKDFLPLK